MHQLHESLPVTTKPRRSSPGWLSVPWRARLFRVGLIGSLGVSPFVLATLILLLTGCGIGRTYHDSDNMWKLGYSDTQLNETFYRVSYAGYGIPQSECDDFAIMRAAELTKENGYKHFRIVTEKQSSQSQSFYLPGSNHTTGTVSRYGNFSTINATSYSSGLMGTVNYPVSTLTIEVLNEQDPSPDSLKAELIWSSLAKRHGVTK